MNSVIPAARASSIAYWISGRSTSVMISLGTDLVAGRKRVPSPATGKIAFVTSCIRYILQKRSGPRRRADPITLPRLPYRTKAKVTRLCDKTG